MLTSFCAQLAKTRCKTQTVSNLNLIVSIPLHAAYSSHYLRVKLAWYI